MDSHSITDVVGTSAQSSSYLALLAPSEIPEFFCVGMLVARALELRVTHARRSTTLSRLLPL